MRLLMIFSFGFAMTVSASIYSQNTKLNLDLGNVTLREALSHIEQNSEFIFLYKNEELDVNKKVNINLQNASIDEILKELLANQSVTYKVLGRQVIITTPEKGQSGFGTSQPSQNVSGKVTDSSGQPMPGVSIVIKGTATGTITDFDGKYTLAKIPPDAVLVFSFVGMKSQELPVSGKTIVNVTLAEEIIGMEEVVVVGYGVQKKVNLTGSVVSVSSEELADRPVASVGEALQGLVPNLQISTTDGGRPGSSLSWQIRGIGSIGGASDSPLILIDGVPGTPNTLNPDDIESISVLKDAASSAIYGSRAPYGVVIITTKKGKSEQMKVTVNSSISWRHPTQMLNPLGSIDFMNLYNESHANLGLNPYYDQAWIDSVQYRVDHPELNLPNQLVNPTNPSTFYRNVAVDTDWWGATYKNSAFTQNHNINISGGSKAVTYYTSMGVFEQDGLYRYGNDDYKRYTGLINVNAHATKWLEIGLKMQLSRSIDDTPNSPNLQFQAYRLFPLDPIIDPNGNYTAIAHALHAAKEGGRINTVRDNFSNTFSFVNPTVEKPMTDKRSNSL
ncbi:MAG: SusC/RagA family TonB-linked outer membrane protein [Mangrovibacterium sp.]|nr:SusC/RagA family TonB-linked outer membrane protein [Mangrovibacterium sp.]